jgi:glutathione reductase (NADPH)
MSGYDFDLFVVGGGSGGVRAARIAAGHGAKVAIAEEYRFGGTCVIRGCVPKKLFVYASRFKDEFEDAAGFGWTVPEAQFDWPELIANKDREIARLEAAYGVGLEKAGVEIFTTRAVVAGPNTVALGDTGRKVTARIILIATGAGPNLHPLLPGIEHVITSNEAFHLPALPERIAIAGGGYIAIEFAGIFAGLGAEVTLVYRGDKVLRGFDDDLREALSEAYAKRGIRILTGNVFTRIERKGKSLSAKLSGGSAIEADQIMLAIGRSPNTTGLGLEAAGVALAPSGAVKVDDYSASSAAGIYAIGDVTDRVNLTPVAIHDGHAFADTVFGGRPRKVDYTVVPSAVFGTPEIASVGLPEGRARKRYRQLDVYKTRFRPLRHTLSGRDERMLMKLLVDAASERVVGCHVLGPDAAEIVQMAAIAIRMGARKFDFDATMALHPSAAEELVTMRTKWQG